MLTFYLVCFLVGLGLSVVSFAAGHIHFGHLLHHHHGGGHATARAQSMFNAASIAAFLAWFGGGGVVLHQMTVWTELPVSAVAIASGLVGGSAVNRFIGALMRREQPLRATTLIGAIGRVTSLIREGGTGEIVFVINGTRKVSAARADSGGEIDKGVEVVIVRMERGIAYVSTWEELAATTSVA
jgi:hypothetical protein